MTADQKPLMIAIKKYLTERLCFDVYSLFKLNNSELISINDVASKDNAKPQVFIGIENIRILMNYLLPYLKSLHFLTKKFKDFKDLILICYVIYHKLYRNIEIRDLILKLSYNMNNFRLSSNKKNKFIITSAPNEIKPSCCKQRRAKEVNILLIADPNGSAIYLKDGRVLNLETNKFESGLKGGSVFEVVTDKGMILTNSLEKCATIVKLSRHVLSSAFSTTIYNHNNLTAIISEIIIGNYKIKRIGVFWGRDSIVLLGVLILYASPINLIFRLLTHTFL